MSREDRPNSSIGRSGVTSSGVRPVVVITQSRNQSRIWATVMPDRPLLSSIVGCVLN